MKAIEDRLMWNGFVQRYDTKTAQDGLPPGEGVFLACSSWLADTYVLMGRRKEAEELVGRLVKLTNDVGLLAEEYDPENNVFLGNFPQAFFHVALVNSVLNLEREVTPVEKRAKTTKAKPEGAASGEKSDQWRPVARSRASPSGLVGTAPSR